MLQSKQQKLTEFEENIAKKIKLLKERIIKLPAYERRKKGATENFIDSDRDFHSNNKLQYGLMFSHREQNPVIIPTALSQELKLS